MKTWLRTAGGWVWTGLLCLGMTQAVQAQQQGVHMLQHGIYTPPGAIGSRQAMRGGPIRCFFQPVEIIAPPGATISLVEKGRFNEAQPAPRKAGLVLGQVYRLRITNIPFEPGREVFPTIELVDRLHPPKGQEVRFAVPIEFTQEDLELALEGKFVTRVVYLEDPDNALPASGDAIDEASFEVLPSEDPLEVADRSGRPIAIVRLGGRLPDDATGKVDRAFMGNCPPLLNIASDPNDAPVQVTDVAVSVEPQGRGDAEKKREREEKEAVERAAAFYRAVDDETVQQIKSAFDFGVKE
jgi:hypothetical protein